MSKADVGSMTRVELEKELQKLEKDIDRAIEEGGDKVSAEMAARHNEVTTALEDVGRFVSYYQTMKANSGPASVPSPTDQPIPEQAVEQYVNPLHEAQQNQPTSVAHEPDVSQGNPAPPPPPASVNKK